MWIDISDSYEASTDGHIRNKKTKRVLREFVGKDGYLRTQFDGKTRTVHRTIALAFLPKESGKDFVNHIDGDKQNNSVSNLEWCTREENVQHAYSLGLKKPQPGTRNGRCKLSLEQAAYILEHYCPRDEKCGAKALGELFGVAPQTISAVVSGQNWQMLHNQDSIGGEPRP